MWKQSLNITPRYFNIFLQRTNSVVNYLGPPCIVHQIHTFRSEIK